MTTHAHSYRALLRLPELRALLAATLALRLAGRMFALTIVLYALTRTGSPALAGWLAFALVAPGLVISPVAGALIDRAGSVWAVAVDMLTSAGCIAALLLLDRFGWASPPVLLALVGLFSLTSPLSIAGVRALLPRLVPPAALDRANALDTALHGVADIAGPALAGTILGFGGATVAFGTIAAAFVAAALCVRTIRRPGGRLPAAGALLAEAWGGVRLVFRQPTLRGLAVVYALYEIAWGILVVVVPVFAAGRFSGAAAETATGLLWAGLGLVGGIAALIAGHWQAAGRERRVMRAGMLVTAVAIFPLAAFGGLAGMAIGLMLFGLAAGPVDVSVLTLRQRRTDPAVLGRVLSVSISLNMSGGPLGSALAGTLVTWSLPLTCAVGALAAALAALAVRLIPTEDGPVRSHQPADGAPG